MAENMIDLNGLVHVWSKVKTLTADCVKADSLATVATSGSYNDLGDKPTIPSAYTLPTASNTVMGGVKIGSNISVSSGTISITKSNVTSALGYTPPVSDTTYVNATASAAGLMSSSDKSKLDSIAANANNYIHPASHPASMITGLAAVATSGSYSDLSNKPTIPVVPTNVSAFINDAGYLTQHQSLDDYAKKTDVNTALADKLGINDTAAAAIKDGAGNTISTTYTSKADVSALLSTKLGVTATAYAAARDGAGNNIVDTYAKKTDIPTITVDAYLSDTSTNPIQNKAVKTAIDTVTASIPTKVSDLENDAGYLTQHQSLDGYVKSVNGVTPNVAGDVTIAVGGGVSTDTTNTWTVKQTFSDIDVEFEYYKTEFQGSSSATPTESVLFCQTLGDFTLNLSNIVSKIPNGRSTVFRAYLSCFSDGVLTITNAGTLYYVGKASDLALTGTGLLVNILIIKKTSGAVDSVVQSSKLS